MASEGQREDPRERQSVWVQPLLEWPAIERVKARLAGAAPEVPDEVGGMPLSNVGKQLLAWWHEARGEKPMPDAADVQPRALVELLPYIRYLSWEPNGALVFRIYGSALAAATGMDLTGIDVFVQGHKEVEADRQRLRLLHEQPCGILMIRDVFDSSGRNYPCEFMTLPIGPGEDGKKRIIGTVAPAERVEAWSTDVSFHEIFKLRRAVYFDTGAGVPHAPELTV
ncbi:MAG: PAS domain-containing protein [Parvibaculum sp.]|nr:PAS domain-containing protein [Parvibaculum sp.]